MKFKMSTGLFRKQKPKRNRLFFMMWCQDCCRFVQVTNTGAPCRICGSNAITLAHNWTSNLQTIEGGVK